MSISSKTSLYIGAIAALFFLPFLGGVHLFDWDEINFAEISREMIVLGDYLRIHVNFEPFWEKPPLFFWFQVIGMKLFGIGEYGARFPNAICGIITLVVLYRIGYHLHNHRFGLLWAGAYFGSILPHLYFRSGIMDPWFNLFIFLGLYGLVLFYWKKEEMAAQFKANKYRYLALGGLALGLAMLVKGPAAVLIVGLCCVVYWVGERFRWFVQLPQGVLYLLMAFIPPLIWLGIETAAHGSWFSVEFTRYQYRLFSTPDAGHRGFPGYHFVVLLLGCFPASIFAIRGMLRGREGDAAQIDFRRWMMILFWVVLILFTIVKSKIVHYSSMCYFPLAYLAAYSLEALLTEKDRLRSWMKIGLGIIGSILALVSLALPILGRQPEKLAPLFSKDPFAQGNLEAAVNWPYTALIPGILVLLILGYFFWAWAKNKNRATIVLFGGMAVYVFVALVFFIKRIEGYSQRAAIEYIEALQGEDVYVIPHGYKSYAHIFYLDKPIPPDYNPDYTPEIGQMSFQSLQTANPDWLLHSDEVDRPVHIITKVHRADELRKLPQLREVGSKNGFVFFVRE